MRAHILVVPLVVLLASCNEANSKPAVESGKTEDSHVEAGGSDTSLPQLIQISEQKLELSEFKMDTFRFSDEGYLRATGTIGYNENKISHIGSRTDGRVTDLLVDIGTKVVAGQRLGTLESPLIGQIRAEEKEALAVHRITEENYKREKGLMEQGISTRKEYLASELEFRKGEAALRSAKERLQTLGAEDGAGSTFKISAPFNGVIVQKHVSLGEMVSPSDQLFTIADMSKLWVQVEIFERDIGKLFVGQKVLVRTVAYPNREFIGKVFNLGSTVDSAKKTLTARVELQNDDRALKPGMFANASIKVEGAQSTDLIVPLNAIQKIKGASVVFIPTGKPGEFKVVKVDVLSALGDSVAVVQGAFKVGDLVVVGGSHLLKAELSKDDLESHSH